MEFVISDNSCMFAVFNAKGTRANRKNGYFYVLLTAIICKDIRLFKSHVVHSFLKSMVPLARMRGEQSFLFNTNSNFVTTMPKENEICKATNNSSPSTTPTSAKTVKSRKLTKLEKSIQSVQERVKELRDGYEYERLEHCKCLFFIARNFPNSFVSFIKEFGEDADWEKLCNKELEITNSKKA